MLAISGTKDDCIGKYAPEGTATGKALWDEVVEGMACSENVSVEFVEKGGHGVYEGGKSGKALARNEQTTLQLIQWIDEFTGHT